MPYGSDQTMAIFCSEKNCTFFTKLNDFDLEFFSNILSVYIYEKKKKQIEEEEEEVEEK